MGNLRVPVQGLVLVAGLVWLAAGTVAAATPTPTPAPTAGVTSERGLLSFVVFLVLIGGALWYLRRRRPA